MIELLLVLGACAVVTWVFFNETRPTAPAPSALTPSVHAPAAPAPVVDIISDAASALQSAGFRSGPSRAAAEQAYREVTQELGRAPDAAALELVVRAAFRSLRPVAKPVPNLGKPNRRAR